MSAIVEAWELRPCRTPDASRNTERPLRFGIRSQLRTATRRSQRSRRPNEMSDTQPERPQRSCAEKASIGRLQGRSRRTSFRAAWLAGPLSDQPHAHLQRVCGVRRAAQRLKGYGASSAFET